MRNQTSEWESEKQGQILTISVILESQNLTLFDQDREGHETLMLGSYALSEESVQVHLAMSEIKFPKLRADGSFVVFARFATKDPKIVALVQDYVKAWIRANRTWKRIWRSDVIYEEQWELHAEFLTDPYIEVGPEPSSFSLVLEGRPGTKRWRDWAVYLIKDIKTVFSEATFEEFDSQV